MRQWEISPLDGRYRAQLSELPRYFSEFALMEARCNVELAYLEALDRTALFPPLSGEERKRIQAARSGFSEADFERIVAIEREIDHDVKACEIYLRERLALSQPNMIHFGLTSDDVNNLAYGVLLTRFRDEQQLPLLRSLIERLVACAQRWRAFVFPARTHGQPASPTTLGKELSVFVSRLVRQARQLELHRFRGKLAGATGTHAAAVYAFPEHDWLGFSEQFVTSLDLAPNPCTTQIEDHDTLAEYFAIVARINSIVCDFDRDMWEYLSRGDLRQTGAAEEVGSSTMPHKVNPIRFENSEGNVAISNALLYALADKLTQSRMQRDLSDTTVKRSIGVALAHSQLAVGQAARGLARIEADEAALRAKVDALPEVLAEGYQTLLRAAGANDPYELLRRNTKGVPVTRERLHALIDRLELPPSVAERLRGLRPSEYVGLAVAICDRVLADAASWLAG